MSLSRLIEAMNIFLKYGDPENPTHCEHDELVVLIHPQSVSQEDIDKLDQLGFFPTGPYDEEDDCFKSFRYGSA